MLSKQDMLQPMLKEKVRTADSLCYLRFRNLNCANWSNSCSGDRCMQKMIEN